MFFLLYEIAVIFIETKVSNQKINHVDPSTPDFHRIDNIKFTNLFQKFYLEILLHKEQSVLFFCV